MCPGLSHMTRCCLPCVALAWWFQWNWMQQGFIPVHAVWWLNVMLYTYLPPTTSASTFWNQFSGGRFDCLANCCRAWENRRNRTPTYCSAMESWYGVMSVAMVIAKSHLRWPSSYTSDIATFSWQSPGIVHLWYGGLWNLCAAKLPYNALVLACIWLLHQPANWQS